jgi:hypothetical protein
MPAENLATVDECLNAIFGHVTLGRESQQYADAVTAFEAITGHYLSEILRSMPKYLEVTLANVRIDHVGLVSMLKHFQRDAYGLQRFAAWTSDLVRTGQIQDAATGKLIVAHANSLGLRVASEKPRKTKVAATFCLWMCVFRPVTFNLQHLKGFNKSGLEVFCASFNFWITCNYLRKFGTVIIRELPDAAIRIERIKHDFTVRDVGFSSLETLFCSIFRPNQRVLDEERAQG